MSWLQESKLVSAAFVVLAALSVAAVVVRLTGLGARVWPVASLTAFTLYLVPVALAGALAALLLSHRGPAVALLTVAVVLVFATGSRATSNEQPEASGPQLRITSANLLLGRADPEAVAEIVRRRDPDVLALQEYMPGTAKKFRAAGVFDTLPYLVRRTGDRRADTVIMSRWPIELVEGSELPDAYTVARVVIPASGSTAARSVPIVSAHPTPPLRPAEQGRWQRWLDALPGPSAELAGGIVAGDFNATVDHVQFRELLGRGWRDVADELGQGLRPTWKGGSSLTPTRALQLTIDHVLIPPGAAARDYAIDPLRGSDHRAITATLVLPE